MELVKLPALLERSQLEQWHPELQDWLPVLAPLDLQPGSLLLLRLRHSRAPLRSDTVSGLVSELFGTTSVPRSGMHVLP